MQMQSSVYCSANKNNCQEMKMKNSFYSPANKNNNSRTMEIQIQSTIYSPAKKQLTRNENTKQYSVSR